MNSSTNTKLINPLVEVKHVCMGKEENMLLAVKVITLISYLVSDWVKNGNCCADHSPNQRRVLCVNGCSSRIRYIPFNSRVIQRQQTRIWYFRDNVYYLWKKEIDDRWKQELIFLGVGTITFITVKYICPYKN